MIGIGQLHSVVIDAPGPHPPVSRPFCSVRDA
jgi:hypothetical protein